MLHFKSAESLSVSVEWELQLIARDSHSLSHSSAELCTNMAHDSLPGSVTPGWERSQLVLRTSPGKSIAEMRSKLQMLKQTTLTRADALAMNICGGGTHPFQRWQDCHINTSHPLGARYGNSLKQGAGFGINVKIGCRNGEEAVFLAQRLLQYAPFLIALSASSPYVQGYDSGFESGRLARQLSLPTAGIIEPARNWSQFTRQLEHMITLGVVKSCQDLMWDIRPNAEDGTVDVRVCDSPLSAAQVCDLAALIQMTAHHLTNSFNQQVPYQIFHTYQHNRFQACCHGFEAQVIDIDKQSFAPLTDACGQWLKGLLKSAAALSTTAELDRCMQQVALKENAAAALRRHQGSASDLRSLVGMAVKVFGGEDDVFSLAA